MFSLLLSYFVVVLTPMQVELLGIQVVVSAIDLVFFWCSFIRRVCIIVIIVVFRVVVVMGVELAWNVFPSTVWSSTLLHVLHFAILTTLYQSGPQFQHRTGKDM